MLWAIQHLYQHVVHGISFDGVTVNIRETDTTEVLDSSIHEDEEEELLEEKLSFHPWKKKTENLPAVV